MWKKKKNEVKLWMQGITLQRGAIVEASPVHLSWPACGISAIACASTRGTGWAGVLSVLWGPLLLAKHNFPLYTSLEQHMAKICCLLYA